MASSVVALASASMDDTAPVASREDVTRLSLTNVHASERLMVIRERKSRTTPKIIFQVRAISATNCVSRCAQGRAARRENPDALCMRPWCVLYR